MKINSPILSFLMLVAVFSCQKQPLENNGPIVPSLDSKEQVTLNLKIRTTSSLTTRTSTVGVAGESEINNVTVFAFNADGEAEAVASQTTSTVGVVDVTKIALNLTEGEKTIIAVVNTSGIDLPGEISENPYTLADLESVSLAMEDNDVSEIATSGLFTMIGKATVAITANSVSNTIEVPVDRLAAKVSLEVDATKLNEANSNVASKTPLMFAATVITTAEQTTLPLQAPTFALNQISKVLNVYEPSETKTPYGSGFELFGQTIYKAALATVPAEGTTYDQSLYCSKNNPDVVVDNGIVITRNRATMVSLKLQLIPTMFISEIKLKDDVTSGEDKFEYVYKTIQETSGNDVTEYNGSETYYGFVYEEKVYAPFYTERTALRGYNAVTGGDAQLIPKEHGQRYDNCINYYGVRIGLPTVTDETVDGYYQVLSNRYYRIAVEAVANFGVGIPDIVTNKLSDIIVSITAKPWDLYTIDSAL